MSIERPAVASPFRVPPSLDTHGRPFGAFARLGQRLDCQEGIDMDHKRNIHKGDLIAKPGEIYECEEITGDLYVRGADTKTAFPKLTTVGG